MTTMTNTITRPRDSTGSGVGDGFQVILQNDDHNAFDYVVACLVKIFDHNEAMARKIALEAHERGKAIAQVEDEESAMKHCLSLRLCGLGADVEQI